jgi:diacylglycerol O-acyltransferase
MGYDRLSGLDTAFLCLDSPSAPMNLGALAVFSPSQPVHPTRLVELLRDRAARIPRLGRRPRTMLVPLGAVEWVPDPDFLVDRHIHAHHLRRPRDAHQLTDLVSELMSERLDPNRPLWELHAITGLPGGRFAVLAKLHHALADGAGAVLIGLSLMDGYTPPAAPEVPAPRRAGGMTDLARRGAKLVNDSAAALTTLPEQARRVRESLDIAAAVVRGARTPELTSPLLTVPSRERQLATLRIRLSEIKRVRARYGGTTNDVLLAILAGALRDWMLGRGEDVDDRVLRALVPVNQRCRTGGAAGGGNQLSGYVCELPIGEPDPVRRLVATREAMDRNKEAGPMRGAGALPVLAERLPAALHRLATPLVSGGASLLFDLVATNVQLPNLPLHFDDAPMQEIYPVVPLAAGHALAVAFCGYGDAVHIGLHGNADALPDLHTLADGFRGTLGDLHALSA